MSFLQGLNPNDETSEPLTISDGFAVVVPAGARHNIKNDGTEPLKLYTLYGPPDHKDKTVHKTEADAEAQHDADEWDGGTTE